MFILLILFLSLPISLSHSQPHDSVIQMPPGPAPGPSSDPTQLNNLTRLMSTSGCNAFAEALTASGAAQKAFEEVVEGGLTVFCPGDEVFEKFSPKFKNLTPLAKTSLLEFHGVPIYMPLPILKSNNGPTNTLATDGANTFDFTLLNDAQDDVTIVTSLVTAKVARTVFDEPPLVIFSIDNVLKPEELFTSAHAPPPASDKAADAPSDSPDNSPADQDADGNSAIRVDGGKFFLASVALGACLGFSLL